MNFSLQSDESDRLLDRGFAHTSIAGTPGTPTSMKIPFFYALLIRFDSYDNMVASGAKTWFETNIVPSLFAYNAATTPIALDYYEGVFVTVAAGDRNVIYETQADIVNFLRNQTDEVTNQYVTVENHVMIKDANLTEFNTKVKNLLSTAQNTFRPSAEDAGADLATYPNGEAGASGNTFYRKAVTTEILQNAFADADLRSYLMHGVWQSMYDHENSHIDVRFQQAAGPVGLDTSEHLEESFASGGDDYIHKPFRIEELLFRIDAIAKRLYQDDKELALKPKVATLLHILCTHTNEYVSREEIESLLWESEELPDAAILRIYIKELHILLGQEFITNQRGVGYKLDIH